MPFTTILCAVDFSAESRRALRYAAAAARRFGGQLTALFVNDPLLLAAAGRAYGSERTFIDRTRTELAGFVRTALPAPQPSVALEIASGNPADEILAAARRRRADLVVVGTHGLSGIRKLFFGSTTEQVLRRATVPVLTVPRGGGRRAPAALDVSRVVAPIDLAGEWESDAVRAGEIARAFGAELLLMHVVAPVQAPPWLGPASRVPERQRIDKAARALERVRSKLFADLRSASAVRTGDAAEEIARMAGRGSSLVVMSLRGTRGVWGARRGSIAYHVLTRSSTPVLALPRRRIGGRLAARAARAIGGALSERDRLEIAGIDALLSAGSRR